MRFHRLYDEGADAYVDEMEKDVVEVPILTAARTLPHTQSSTCSRSRRTAAKGKSRRVRPSTTLRPPAFTLLPFQLRFDCEISILLRFVLALSTSSPTDNDGEALARLSTGPSVATPTLVGDWCSIFSVRHA